MKIKIMSHLATWIVLFLIPVTISPIPFPYQLLPVGAVVALFYMNFFWLTPYHYMKGRILFCWGVNLLMVLGIGWLMHRILGVRVGYLVYLSVAVIISISMRLGSIWQQSEEARLKAEATRADAELRDLRYQTNPHFLLNTLNNIYALMTFDTKRAQDAIQQLSAMLRHVLYDNHEKEIKMEDEIEFLQSYISLMKIRQSGEVDVTFDVEQADKSVRIVPLILIPLVENAFKHGIGHAQPSFIHITLKADNSHIDFDIKNSVVPNGDNGQKGHGIGLTQVQKRLELAYPGNYTWQHGLTDDASVYDSHIIINLHN